MSTITKTYSLSMHDKRISASDREVITHAYYSCKFKGYNMVNIIRTLIGTDDYSTYYEPYVIVNDKYDRYIEIRLVSVEGCDMDRKSIDDLKEKLKLCKPNMGANFKDDIGRLLDILYEEKFTTEASMINIEQELLSCMDMCIGEKRAEYELLLKKIVHYRKGILAFPYLLRIKRKWRKLNPLFCNNPKYDMKITSDVIEDYDDSSIYPSTIIAMDMMTGKVIPSRHEEARHRCYKYMERQQLDNCEKGGTDMAQYGVITEQGDLGLGYDPLNEKDNKIVNESVRSSVNKSKEDEDDKK